MIYLFMAVFAGAFILAAGACWAARRLALKFNYIDRPDRDRKQHTAAVPYGGGLALIAVYAVISILMFACAHWVPAGWWPQAIQPHIPGFQTKLNEFFILVGAAVLIGLLGFADDVKPVKEILKLVLELGLAAGLWWLGFRITVHIHSPVLSFVITVLWIAGLANAFNFLDNMDGLSAGVACIASLLFAVFGLQTHQLFIAGYFILIAGASLGFLVYNFPPASMFLGDCGSLFLGLLIAVGAVVSTFSAQGVPNRILPLLAPLLILAVPLFDFTSVIVIRLIKGRPLLKADRNHFSHRLVRLGMNARTAVLTIYLVAAGVGFSAFYLIRLSTRESILALVQALCVFLIIVLLEYAGRGKREKEF